MHPLVNSFADMKDAELEAKISDLTKKYFMTNNVDVRYQMSMLLDSYRSEMAKRQFESLNKLMKSSDKTLDNLIKVN